MLALKETFYDKSKNEGFIEAQVQIVKNMIKKNYDDNLINDATNVSIEEIAKIREEHSKQ